MPTAHEFVLLGFGDVHFYLKMRQTKPTILNHIVLYVFTRLLKHFNLNCNSRKATPHSLSGFFFAFKKKKKKSNSTELAIKKKISIGFFFAFKKKKNRRNSTELAIKEEDFNRVTMGRSKSAIWSHVTVLEGNMWRCRHCLQAHSGNATRIRDHLFHIGNNILYCPVLHLAAHGQEVGAEGGMNGNQNQGGSNFQNNFQELVPPIGGNQNQCGSNFMNNFQEPVPAIGGNQNQGGSNFQNNFQEPVPPIGGNQNQGGSNFQNNFQEPVPAIEPGGNQDDVYFDLEDFDLEDYFQKNDSSFQRELDYLDGTASNMERAQVQIHTLENALKDLKLSFEEQKELLQKRLQYLSDQPLAGEFFNQISLLKGKFDRF
ncbi:hypothetical protein QL285_088992 [Trifolium repens]|nr:hypothetical protein QL285_088992 [Trifolium repens]